MVKVAQRGMKNRESLSPVKRPVMTLEKLGHVKVNLMKLGISTRRKRTIWVILVFLFFGSLRGSEVLAPIKKQFDPLQNTPGPGCEDEGGEEWAEGGEHDPDHLETT